MSRTDKDLPFWVKKHRGELVVADYVGHPPASYVRELWHVRERARERDRLRVAVQIANGVAGPGRSLADLDDRHDLDFPNNQARHSAHWTWV